MAFTDNSDVFAAVHENGINAVIRHVMRQRPSLFNYGTALVRANPRLLCAPIEAAPGVTELITETPPLPLFGADDFALNFAAQLTNLAIEFHPGNVIDLPPELNPPLQQQRFAFRADGCAGLGCPSTEGRSLFDSLFELSRFTRRERAALVRSPRGAPSFPIATLQPGGLGTVRFPIGDPLRVAPVPTPTTTVFPTRELACFCLGLAAVGQSDITGTPGNQRIKNKLDNLEIVDLAPSGLEKSLECYLLLVVNQSILPPINDAISNTLFSLFQLGGSGSLLLSAATTVPNNPAIEENQLKAFINLDALSLQVPPITIGAGGDEGPEVTKTERSRSGSGPFHLTAAVSEQTFLRVFGAVRDNTTFDITVEPRTIVDSALGSVKASAHIKFHLDNGNVNFGNDNTVQINELDVKWDKLEIGLALDLPELCIPPFQICVPVLGCSPQFCIFEAEDDIPLTLNLPTIFTTEVSIDLRPQALYGTSSAGNQWIVQLAPIGPVDIDLIDVADTVGDLLDDAIGAIVDLLGLPDAVEDIAETVVDAIRDLLDIGDDAGEWLAELVFDTLGIELGIGNLLFKLFTDEFQVLAVDDPIEVLEGEPPLIPVTIPVAFLGARVNSSEMIIEVDVEA